MDIISHTLTGITVGTVVATISKGSWREKCAIILVGGFGGALPDFDAISLWSKFDIAIGSFLGLTHTGKQIYFGKFWYSHHAAMHSIIAPFLFIVISILFTIVLRNRYKLSIFKESVLKNKYKLLAFFFGFLGHLFEDMPTPASVWGGVNLFFPSKTYIGGFGDIWWWNNYDLVLIIISTIILNLLVNLIHKKHYKLKIISSTTIFVLGIALFIFQIKTRPIDFKYLGHTTNYKKFESESKRIQKEILGDKIFNIMSAIDNKIPLNF